jgi:hypothetical protein
VRPNKRDKWRIMRTGRSGDLQADVTNHGGPEKALQHYPRDHYSALNAHRLLGSSIFHRARLELQVSFRDRQFSGVNCFMNVGADEPIHLLGLASTPNKFVTRRSYDTNVYMPRDFGTSQGGINFTNGYGSPNIISDDFIRENRKPDIWLVWGNFINSITKWSPNTAASHGGPNLQICGWAMPNVFDYSFELQSYTMTIIHQVASYFNIDFDPRALRGDGGSGGLFGNSNGCLHIARLLSSGGQQPEVALHSVMVKAAMMTVAKAVTRS